MAEARIILGGIPENGHFMWVGAGCMIEGDKPSYSELKKYLEGHYGPISKLTSITEMSKDGEVLSDERF